MAEPLTRGQQIFAGIVARETGLDPKVVGAWAKSEQSGSAAEFYDKSNYHNYLNIARTDGGDAKGSHSGVWSNPESAAKATAEWIKGQGPITKEYGKAAPGIRAILGTAGKDPASQINAIGRSGWATAPDYGQKIGALYHELSGTQLKLLSAAQRAAGAYAGVAPVVPESSTAPAAPAPPPEPNPYTALMAVHTGASPIVEKNWQMLSNLFDQEQAIRQPHSTAAPAIALPGEGTEAFPRQKNVPDAKGVVKFGDKQVAGWIAPILKWAQEHGWNGSVTSGYRSYAEQKRIYDSGVRPAAVPGTSNHEGSEFPKGAVDVSEAQQLSDILAKSPYAHALVYAGAKDPVHFSHPHSGSY